MKAEEVARRLCERELTGRDEDDIPSIAAALTLAQQEARAERDREWRDAVRRSWIWHETHSDNCSCAKLRALLEGK